MQRNKMTDVVLLYIGGTAMQGVLKTPETGYTEDGIEVPTSGVTAMIGTGQKKLEAKEYEFLVQRQSPTLKYFIDWRDNNDGESRDVVHLHTDKTGKPENWWLREIFTDCEPGDFKVPDFDQASRKTATLKIKLFPGGYQRQTP